MYEEDEEELELLRQYEENDLNDGVRQHSSDELDSDLEEKIMSLVQYRSGSKEKKPLSRPSSPKKVTTQKAPPKRKRAKVETVHAPLNVNEKHTEFSAANELNIISSDSEGVEDGEYLSEESDKQSEQELDGETVEESEDKIEDESSGELEDEVMEEAPLVTRHISLDDKRYMDDEETSEEEAELGKQIQELIDSQADGFDEFKGKRGYRKKTFVQVCNICHGPGHYQSSCQTCKRCGSTEHTQRRCDWLEVCRKCKRHGHIAIDCSYRDELKCKACEKAGHEEENCDQPFHDYINIEPAVRQLVPYCFNCSDRNHYGSDCTELPQKLLMLPNIFVGNKPTPKKVSKKRAYYDESRSSSYESKSQYAPVNKKTKYKKAKKENEQPSSKPKVKWVDQKKNSKGKGVLAQFFQLEKNPGSYNHTGNSNWKAINNNNLPQPTRSGTVQFNQQRNNQGQQQRGNQRQQQQNNQYQQQRSNQYQQQRNNQSQHQQQRNNQGQHQQRNNPRPQQRNSRLPQPNKSGVIDLT